jgi:hypothetical protein
MDKKNVEKGRKGYRHGVGSAVAMMTDSDLIR